MALLQTGVTEGRGSRDRQGVGKKGREGGEKND
jgi:hypothetical protein